MKEIKDLYKAIARVHSYISRSEFEHIEVKTGDWIEVEDGEPDTARCKRKEKDCREEHPEHRYEVMNACITNAISEAFAPSGSTPLEILCAAAKAACFCEVDFNIKSCEKNKAYGDCVQFNSAEGPACPRPGGPGANEDCGNVDDPYARGGDWCDNFCSYCAHVPSYYCGDITRLPTGDHEGTLHLCKFIEIIIRHLKSSPTSGIFKTPCSTWVADPCEKCDCKKEFADKLKGIAEQLRPIIKRLGCKIDIGSDRWYDTFDVDECKAPFDCGEEAPTWVKPGRPPALQAPR